MPGLIGVDIGGTNIKAALIQDGRITRRRRIPTNAHQGVAAVINQIARAIDGLGKKAAEIKEDLRVEFKAQMDELRKKLDAADRKLQELKDAGSKEWERVKAETDAAVAEVERLYREAADRFK